MKKVILVLIVLVVFTITAYAQKCECTDRNAIIWGQKHYGYSETEFGKGFINNLFEADDLEKKKDYWGTIEKYKKAIDTEDYLPEPYGGIAYCYLQLGYKYQAMEYYREACAREDCAIDHNPDFSYCEEYKKLRLELLGY